MRHCDHSQKLSLICCLLWLAWYGRSSHSFCSSLPSASMDPGYMMAGISFSCWPPLLSNWRLKLVRDGYELHVILVASSSFSLVLICCLPSLHMHPSFQLPASWLQLQHRINTHTHTHTFNRLNYKCLITEAEPLEKFIFILKMRKLMTEISYCQIIINV